MVLKREVLAAFDAENEAILMKEEELDVGEYLQFGCVVVTCGRRVLGAPFGLAGFVPPGVRNRMF